MYQSGKQSELAFTLIELAMVMVVIGLLVMPLLAIYTKMVEQRRWVETKEKMHDIRKAMSQYYYTNNKYPCPAAMTTGGENYAFSTNCQLTDDIDIKDAETFGVFVGSDGNGHRVIEGAIPYRILNVSKDQVRDGWGNMLTYSVTMAATLPGFQPGSGAIGIVDEKGVSLIEPQNSAFWALISHGSNKSGAYSSTSSKPWACKTRAMDGRNCSHSGRYTVAPYSEAAGEYNYDDIVYYQTWAEIPEGIAPGYCMTGQDGEKGFSPRLVQDGAILRVCAPDPEKKTAVNVGSHSCQFQICRGGNLIPVVTDIYDGEGNHLKN